MFEARFSEAASFKKLVEALKDFKEINLECDLTGSITGAVMRHSFLGIRLEVMDECHVSLADLKLSSSYFERYICEQPWYGCPRDMTPSYMQLARTQHGDLNEVDPSRTERPASCLAEVRRR